MKILLNDVLQGLESNVTTGSEQILTPDLSDVGTDSSYIIEFDSASVNCLALGNVSYTGTTIRLRLYTAPSTYTEIDITNLDTTDPATRIYYLSTTYNSIVKAEIIFLTSASFDYVGRIGLGVIRNLPIYKAREPGFMSTTKSRKTLGGHVVPGLGGIVARTVSCELKAKIIEDVFDDLEKARYHLAREFPYFIDFSDESDWLTIGFFYAIDKRAMVFQSSFKKFIYSKRFEFEECF